MSVVRFAIAGAAGRMGRRIVALAGGDSEMRCCAALESAGHPELGKDSGELAGVGANGVRVSAEWASEFDVLIDFSSPKGTAAALELCRRNGRPILIGTTGLGAEEMKAIREAAGTIAVLQSPNMSVGIALLLGAVRELSQRLGAEFDVEVVEAHHRHKADAPSGTALALAEAVRAGRARAGRAAGELRHGREGRDAVRGRGEIGVHAIRMGETAGEHTVYFSGAGETISVNHVAHSRDTFAIGALRAAKWLSGKGPGMYSMGDVLEIEAR